MTAQREALTIVEPQPSAKTPPGKRRYPREFIANKLNYLNFQKRHLIVRLEHIPTGRVRTRRAFPDRCLGKQLFCAWSPNYRTPLEDVTAYRVIEILIPDERHLFTITAQQSRVGAEGLHLILPDACTDGNQRRLKRYPVKGIEATVNAKGLQQRGRLINFNAESFLVKLSPGSGRTQRPPRPGETVSLHLSDGGSTCYTGACRIKLQPLGTPRDGVVLIPLNEAVKRFEAKRHRCPRYQPHLRPDVTWTHPLLKRPHRLKAEDLSGGGFAVCEARTDATLLPGMRIRDLELRFQESNAIRCDVLVIYRNEVPPDRCTRPLVRCGLVITAISPEAHTRLLAYLSHASNQRTYLCTPVEMDALWHFFFETGFIYPEKYTSFGDRLATIRDTYRKLYETPSSISRHFIYQENGVIRAHVAGIRAYEDSWMIHHLAANTSASPLAGLAVLNQISQFLMAASNLTSNRMNYIINYYQAEKKFSRRVWGGVARHIADPRKCCEHRFTYLWIRKTPTPARQPRSAPFRLRPCRRGDLAALKAAYRSDHGDLMLAALDLVPERIDATSLTDEYHRLGLPRSRQLFAIEKDARLEAVCMVHQTTAGLNMSDLINNIQVLVMPESEMPAAALQPLLQTLAEPFEQEEVAVLLYPSQYARNQYLHGERLYTLWVLDTDASDDYFAYINRIMRFR